MRRRTRAVRDLGFALLFFVTVFAISYVAGRAFLPLEVEVLAQGGDQPQADEPVTESIELGPSSLAALYEETDEFHHVGAVAEVAGTVNGRFVLDRFEWDEWIDHGVPEGPLLDLDATYLGEGATVRISARQMEEGVPRTDGLTVILNADGKAFNAQPGDCSLELVSLEFVELPGRLGMTGLPERRNMPRYTGEILCNGVADLRGEGSVSFALVFVYDPG